MHYIGASRTEELTPHIFAKVPEHFHEILQPIGKVVKL
jgi:hypothetical protein